MISTRLHGLIDYSVATLLGGASAAPMLPRPVRTVLGSAAGFHATYSAATDYEAGVTPILSMRQHLVLDVLGAAALCGAGLMMRRQPLGARALLVAAGVAELAVVGLSSARPVSGPGQGTGALGRVLGADKTQHRALYFPLDTPKPFAEDVWIVDSALPGLLGKILPVRMTVIRLANGDLLLHSPTRYSIGLRRELEKLGRIRHLVAPNLAHWTFLEGWQRACPGAVVWAAPGLRQRSAVQKSGLLLDHDLTNSTPAAWGEDIGLVLVPGGMGFHEAALFHRRSRTLILTDLVLNLEPEKLPPVVRAMVRLFGAVAPNGMPPPYLRAIVKLQRQAAAEAVSRLLELQPERVIFAHGRCFEQGASAALRHSFRWLL